ncbi:sarcosine oxidase subunit beta [Palaeococcus pacificus DY20341]|uniref:Sarcosine oxidase subunit beta n=1 Tax=Palaeococcus pacificus DY20341 TaxID=1343739 RepID=A0A075LU65_9EURY|nr:FAD-binding oxidoreductase [Palaeococcus pacificus]AIF69507.1 sarcosine oxidase subunit beta [Palaeococcus pacificus DY20341]
MKTDVVVIGGGVIGLSIAYNLAKLGVKCAVFEKGYLGNGSTFRCATGIRAQFTDEANIKLMKYSVERWKKLSEELEYDVNFKQTGYLFLATSEEEIEAFKRNIALQNKFGVPTRLITPEEAKEIVPPLNTEPFLGGAWNPEDGKANPFKTVFAYAEKAKELGAEIYEYTPVEDIIVEDGSVKGVKTSKGIIKADVVVNAANSWAPLINEMAGLDRDFIPIKAYKHQLIKTEPLAPGQIEPLVCPPAWNDSYVIQDGEDGGVICGSGIESVPKNLDDVSPTYDFMRGVLRWATQIVPALKYVHVLRQWAGFYAKTPDSNPAIGKINHLEGFYIAAGFSGHGFMMAPAVGEAMAELIAKGKSKVPLDWEWYDPHRFERGELRSSAFQIG